MELIYTCIARLVKYLDKTGADIDHDRFGHYLDPDDYNKVIYHSRNEDVDDRMLKLLDDADRLLEICKGGYDDVTEYKLFSRCMSEQTMSVGQSRRLRTREDGGMDSNMIQNPSDPDATFRKKAGKEHRGYVANMEESVGENGSIVTDYQFEKNNVSDSEMLKEHIEKEDFHDETVTMVTDGAYSGIDNVQLDAEKNIDIVPTDLAGKDTDPFVSGFNFNEDGTRLVSCPAGNEPRSCSYNKQTGQCVVSFDRDKCASCPFRDQCHPKIFKRVAKKTISKKSVARATYIREKSTDRFRMLARLRNGVETIPSILKNIYDADHMPVRGLMRYKFFFGG